MSTFLYDIKLSDSVLTNFDLLFLFVFTSISSSIQFYLQL